MHRNGSRLVDISQFLLTMARYGLLYANILSPLPGADTGPGRHSRVFLCSRYRLGPALLIVITGGQGSSISHNIMQKIKQNIPSL